MSAQPQTEPTWDYWLAALAGKAGPTSEGYPEQGFWRKPNQNGGFDPVAIWWQDGQWWARVGAGRYEDADKIWTWCAKHPIAHEEYEKVLAGGTWSNLDPVVAAQIAEGQAGKKAKARRRPATTRARWTRPRSWPIRSRPRWKVSAPTARSRATSRPARRSRCATG